MQIQVLQGLICKSIDVCMIACMHYEISLHHSKLWLLPLMGYQLASFFLSDKKVLA
jgi:hypothetical protein